MMRSKMIAAVLVLVAFCAVSFFAFGAFSTSLESQAAETPETSSQAVLIKAAQKAWDETGRKDDAPAEHENEMTAFSDEDDDDPYRVSDQYGCANVTFVYNDTDIVLGTATLWDGYLEPYNVPVVRGEYLHDINKDDLDNIQWEAYTADSYEPEQDVMNAANFSANIIHCYYREFPKFQVSTDTSEVLFGGHYKLHAEQVVPVGEISKWDCTDYYEFSNTFQLAGAYDYCDLSDCTVKCVLEYADGNTVEEDMMRYMDEPVWENDRIVTFHSRREKSASPLVSAFATSDVVRKTFVYDVDVVVRYDESAYGESGIAHDDENHQWIGGVNGVSQFYVPYWGLNPENEFSALVQEGPVRCVGSQMIVTNGEQEVRISDCAHLSVYKRAISGGGVASVFASDDSTPDGNATFNALSQYNYDADEWEYSLGDSVDYAIYVVNDGCYPVTNVILRDDLTHDRFNLYMADNTYDHEQYGVLMPGESALFYTTYDIKKDDVQRGYVDNDAYISQMKSTEDGVHEWSSPGTCRVRTYDNGMKVLDVTKEIDAPKDRYKIGDELVYKITVTNNTDTPSHHVVLLDQFDGIGDLGAGTITAPSGEVSEFEWGSCTDEGTIVTPWEPDLVGRLAYMYNPRAVEIGDIAPGQTYVITATHVITKEDLLSSKGIYNSAYVQGHVDADPNFDVMIGWDDNFLESNPSTAMTLVKTLTSATAGHVFKVGEKVEYDLVVTNTGEFTLHQVVVKDDGELGTASALPEGVDRHYAGFYVVDRLDAGESATIHTSYTVQEKDVTMTASDTAYAFGLIEVLDEYPDPSPFPPLPKSFASAQNSSETFMTSAPWYENVDVNELISAYWPLAQAVVNASADWQFSVEGLQRPALSLTVDPIGGHIKVGDEVEFVATVENTSNVTIEDIVLTDEHGNTIAVGTLAPGEKKENIKVPDTIGEGYKNELVVEGRTIELRDGTKKSVSDTYELSESVNPTHGTIKVNLIGQVVEGAHSFDVHDDKGNKVTTIDIADNKGAAELPFGKYVVKHATFPDGTIKALDTSFVLEPSTNDTWRSPVVEKDIAVDTQKMRLVIESTCDGVQCPDATYLVTEPGTYLVADPVEDGLLEGLTPGTYTITMDTAPKGYRLVGDKEQKVTLSYDSSGADVVTTTVRFEFEPIELPTGTVTITSVNPEDPSQPNNLSDAQYKLSAAEPITDEDGNLVYEQGEQILIIRGADDDEVVATVPVGKYYLNELMPPRGCGDAIYKEKLILVEEGADISVIYENVPLAAPSESEEPGETIVGVAPDEKVRVVDNEDASGVVTSAGDVAAATLAVCAALASIALGAFIIRRRKDLLG